jgi:hypothetical protein
MINFLYPDDTPDNEHNYSATKLDIFSFAQQHPQLLAWIQDLDVNPYTLNPYSNQQLTTDIKVLFPNLYPSLFQQSNSTSIQSKSSGSPKKLVVKSEPPQSIDYECQRKFCTFCIRTNYDDNINEIMKNKAWHCYHCTGYCMCTRCTR